MLSAQHRSQSYLPIALEKLLEERLHIFRKHTNDEQDLRPNERI